MSLNEILLPEQQQVNSQVFPVIYEWSGSEDTEDSIAWFEARTAWIREQLLRYGAMLVRGLPVHSPDDFEQLIDRSGFPRMPYIGGAAVRSAVTAGRVLTSNESPSSEPIPFHHEMAQVPNPPAYIFFYCDLPPESGGETAVLHSNRVYQLFQAADADFAKKVEELGVRYIRIMPPEDDASSAIGRSWKSTFQAQSPEQAEAKMIELGTTWEWLENGNLRTETATVPAIRTDSRSQLKTFFNSMVAAYTGWVDARNDPTKSVVCGDGSPVNGEALLKTAAAMEAESVNIQWQKGDVLFIDNNLVLHSRRPFEGARRICATLSPE